MERGVEDDKTEFPNNKRLETEKDRPMLLNREVTNKCVYQQLHNIYTSIII
jgi:hypothetical protein